MSFVQEFGNGSTSSSPSPHTVATPSIIPVGATLIMLCSITGGSGGTVPTATDAKGNTYTLLATEVVTATTSTAYVLYANITTELAAGDLISVTYSPVPTRSAINIAHFDETLTPGPNAVNDNGGNSTATITAGPTSSVVAGSLVFGGACLVNSGRIFTATNGMTTLTKRVSAVSSGERAALSAYKYAASDGGQTFDGTLDSSGTFAAIVQTFTVTVSQSAPSASILIAGAKKMITSGAVIIGGVKKAITGQFVIVGGLKVPTNLLPPITIPAIGDPAYGGYMAGIIDTTQGNIIATDANQVGKRYLLIVAPKSLEQASIQFKDSQSLGPVATRTRWDGLTATQAMAADAATYPAADYCDGLTKPADVGSKWYLPSMDELELIYRNLKPTTQANYTTTETSPSGSFPNNGATTPYGYNPSSDPAAAKYTSATPSQTAVALFQGGSEALSGYYWTATECDATNGWIQHQSGTYAGYQGYANKTTLTLARPVRRVLL